MKIKLMRHELVDALKQCGDIKVGFFKSVNKERLLAALALHMDAQIELSYEIDFDLAVIDATEPFLRK